MSTKPKHPEAQSTEALPPAEVQRIEVTLAKPHTHAGKDYLAGEKIQVRPEQAQRLREQGIVDEEIR